MGKFYRFKDNRIDYDLINRLLETDEYDDSCEDLSDLVKVGLLEEVDPPEGMENTETVMQVILMPDDYVPFPEEPEIKSLFETPAGVKIPTFAPPQLPDFTPLVFSLNSLPVNGPKEPELSDSDNKPVTYIFANGRKIQDAPCIAASQDQSPSADKEKE